MSCPSVDELQRIARAGLGGDAALEAHLDTCPPCRAALSTLARGGGEPARYGRYQLGDELGHGGMGLVHRAHDPMLGRALAIKVVRTHGDRDQQARLLREAQSLGQVSHPNVCQVYDCGLDGDELWVAMELIDGSSVASWLDSGPPRAARLAALLDAAHGLDAVHAAGLVHRDVKPSNLLRARAGRTVVADFGLARGDASSTAAGAALAIGTPAYRAPEQLTGAAVDARTDQFAWGLTAWEVLFGERPFPVDAGPRLIAIRAGVTAPTGAPRALVAVIARALAPIPAQRFGSMREVAVALEAAAAPRRRWRGRVAAGAGIVAAIAIAAVIARGGTASSSARSIVVAPSSPSPSSSLSSPPPSPASPSPASAEVLPAGYHRLAKVSPTDVVAVEAEWANVRTLVMARAADAVLVELSASGQGAAGTVDLHASGSLTASFVLRSALDRGGSPCGYAAALQSTGGYLTEMAEGACGSRPVRWPRCSITTAWRKARLPVDAIANVSFGADADGRPRWTFRAGSRFAAVADDC